jgi:hypothetical protein
MRPEQDTSMSHLSCTIGNVSHSPARDPMGAWIHLGSSQPATNIECRPWTRLLHFAKVTI